MLFADIIVDISHESLDKTYQYIVREDQEKDAVIGAMVQVPFGQGNRMIKGYIVNLTHTPAWDVARMKEISSFIEQGIVIESQLIALAAWMRNTYGGTMNDALKTVLPVKKSVSSKEKKYISLAVSKEEAKELLSIYQKKNYKARYRLLEAIIEQEGLELTILREKLHISHSTIKDLQNAGVIRIESKVIYRNPIKETQSEDKRFVLNEEQLLAVNGITDDFLQGKYNTYLLHGVTGSGKTEVYMNIIETVIKEGRQVIMLIPEIALTYQTVLRFYKRFGNEISILHSRMSQGERYDQYLRAKQGEIKIMIGPRSALFTPFPNLGLIIIDEEQEDSYKSEGTPKYHARETAIARAKLANASVILGSATPTVGTYYHAMKGEYPLYTLKKRAGEAKMPEVSIVDLREELKNKNRSIFSRKLKEAIYERLKRKEQVMLFINRRGYAGFVSCRSCGHVLKCPHCDISLTSHQGDKLVCHYCGFETAFPKLCPECGSPYIAAFGTGTQKIEAFVKKEFPEARVLRMDADTTGGKDGHQKILEAFSNQEADILVGTQMIVKGHDFPEVTLVGILAADLSLHAGNYLAAERTFNLLSQAAGRAGRAKKPGEVIIQTYNPDNYSIVAAARDDYIGFYEKEIMYRGLLGYPPTGHMAAILIGSVSEEDCEQAAGKMTEVIQEKIQKNPSFENMKVIGPAKAQLSKAKDIYRWTIYIKSKEENLLTEIIGFLEEYKKNWEFSKKTSVQIDFDPINSY